jgi:hypothetical protein
MGAMRHLTHMARTARVVIFTTRIGSMVMALSIVIQSLTSGWPGARLTPSMRRSDFFRRLRWFHQ